MKIEVAETKLHFWCHGDPSSKPVVLSHGATLDHRSWDPQVAVLAEKYRVITWDLRGHGLSQPLTGRFSFERGAADLIALLDYLGIERAALVGLSMGAFISQQVAYAHRDRVAALVCFDAASLTHTKLGPAMRLLLAASGKAMAAFPHRLLVEAIARRAALDPEVRDYIREVSGNLTKSAILDIWHAVQTGLRWEPDYKIPHPLMIAVGDNDKVGATLSLSRKWARQCPDARFEIIPRAGHCSNQDNPRFASRILLDFLERHWPSG
ncbi:alpha/beta fold hydrolase [Nitratireductor thuwali]|uniref:Non-heme bromoperoxidase BpoC n=1 Tax=Nitratireductor thuwali TaxID=2267699 RepID=A0ABY5MLL4_9HYPH|nr:Putative non-heme bromoperoxidase BpoC [Nitratireductor thuwali]